MASLREEAPKVRMKLESNWLEMIVVYVNLEYKISMNFREKLTDLQCNL